MTPEENRMHIKTGEMIFRISKPIIYIRKYVVRSATHRTNGILHGETVIVKEHVIEFNPAFPVFGVSVVHELAHAKTDELGYFCFPPLSGNAAQEFDRSWTWIDDYYALQTLAQHSEEFFNFEIALKAGLASQVDPKTYTDIYTTIHDLLFFSLFEALIPRISFADIIEKIREIENVWSPVFKVAPHLQKHKELVKSVLLGLPPQERLTKEQYIDSGLEILFSKHITKSKTTISREEYRQQVFRLVRRIAASPDF